jgi:hypothetical protein
MTTLLLNPGEDYQIVFGNAAAGLAPYIPAGFSVVSETLTLSWSIQANALALGDFTVDGSNQSNTGVSATNGLVVDLKILPGAGVSDTFSVTFALSGTLTGTYAGLLYTTTVSYGPISAGEYDVTVVGGGSPPTEGTVIFGDTPILLRTTDPTVPAQAAFQQSTSDPYSFSSPVQSGAVPAPGTTSTAWTTFTGAATEAVKGMVEQAAVINFPTYGPYLPLAADVTSVGTAMNGTIAGVLTLIQEAPQVISGQISFAEWESQQQSFFTQQQEGYNSLAASQVASQIPLVGWILAPIVSELTKTSYIVQDSNVANADPFQLSVTLDTTLNGGPQGGIILAGNNQYNYINLGAGNTFAAGGNQGNTFTLGQGNDTVIGGAGYNIIIAGGGGKDTIDGNGGITTIIFQGAKSAYSVVDNSNGSVTVTDSMPNRDGTDQITNVAFLQFSDQTVAATAPPPTSVQQEILGLYAALYGRATDSGGVSYWTGIVGQQSDGSGVTTTNAGTTAVTLNDAAVLGQAFVNTQNTYFNQIYGSLNDSAFINALYVNIGGNAGDPGGIAYWATILAQNEAGGQSVQAARAGLVGQFVHDLVDYNLSTATGLTTAQLLAATQRQAAVDNKIAVSEALSTASQQAGGNILVVHAVGDAAFQAASTIIESVTYDLATVTAAILGINAAVAAQNLHLI